MPHFFRLLPIILVSFLAQIQKSTAQQEVGLLNGVRSTLLYNTHNPWIDVPSGMDELSWKFINFSAVNSRGSFVTNECKVGINRGSKVVITNSGAGMTGYFVSTTQTQGIVVSPTAGRHYFKAIGTTREYYPYYTYMLEVTYRKKSVALRPRATSVGDLSNLFKPKPPVITTHPAKSSVVREGSRVTLKVAATGFDLKYQWQKNGQNIRGETRYNLRIERSVPGDWGDYTVIVSNGGGSVTSKACRLYVTYPPKVQISNPPRVKSVQTLVKYVGESAQLESYADGQPAPTYQWQKNGFDIAGATSRIYKIAQVDAADAGDFRVIAKNSLGTAISLTAVLEVASGIRPVSWVASGNGSWHDAKNWSSGVVPGPEDDVIIKGPQFGSTFKIDITTEGRVKSIRSDIGLSIWGGGSLTFTAQSEIGYLELRSGSIVGTGDLSIQLLNWWSGSINVSKLIVRKDAGLYLNSSSLKYFCGTLENFGNVSEGGGSMIFSDGNGGDTPSIFNNRPGGVFRMYRTLERDANGLKQFNNEGTVQKLGTGVAEMQVAFNNDGNLWVQGGTLNLKGGGGGEKGTIKVDRGATLNLQGSSSFPFNYTGGQMISNGTLNLASGPINFNGPFRLLGTTSLNGARIGGTGELTVPGILNWSTGQMADAGKTVIARTGTLNLMDTRVKTLDRVLESTGTVNYFGDSFTGIGTLDIVEGICNWESGTMEGKGKTLVGALAKMNLNGPGTKGLARTLENSGLVDYFGEGLVLRGVTGSTSIFNNKGMFLLSGAGRVQPQNEGAKLFINGGIFYKLGPSPLPVFEVPFANSGSISCAEDQVITLSGGTFSGGDLAAGSVLNITGPTQFDGAFESRGIINLNSGESVNGSGELKITGILNWGSAHFQGSGKLLIAQSGVANLTGTGEKRLAKTLQNEGVVNYSGETLILGDGSNAGGLLANYPTGVFNILGRGEINDGSGTGAKNFTNAGTLIRDSSAAATIIRIPFSNTGSMLMRNGDLEFGNAALQFNGTAVLQIPTGKTLKFLTGNLTGTTTNAANWSARGRLLMVDGNRQFEIMGRDLGNVPAGYTQNFSYGELELQNGAKVTLVDLSDNSPGSEALYVESIKVPVGTTLDLNNLKLYAKSSQIGGNVLGGQIILVPAGATPQADNPNFNPEVPRMFADQGAVVDLPDLVAAAAATQPAQDFRIISLQRNPRGTVTLTWNTDEGEIYGVQQSTTLAGFTDVPGKTRILAKGATTSTTLTPAAGSRCFFRILRIAP